MTKFFFESVNFMLKNIRHLLVSSLAEETYFKTAKLFDMRGRKTQSMINYGSQYFEIVFEEMNSINKNQINIFATYHSAGLKGVSFKKGKYMGVTTNVYSRETLEKPKGGLRILRTKGSRKVVAPHASVTRDDKL